MIEVQAKPGMAFRGLAGIRAKMSLKRLNALLFIGFLELLRYAATTAGLRQPVRPVSWLDAPEHPVLRHFPPRVALAVAQSLPQLSHPFPRFWPRCFV